MKVSSILILKAEHYMQTSYILYLFNAYELMHMLKLSAVFH